MKKLSTFFLATSLMIIGCSNDSKVSSSTSEDVGATAGAMPEPANSNAAASTEPTASNAPKPWETQAQPQAQTQPQQPQVQPQSQAPKPVATPSKYPPGKKVEGKKGFVKSPFAENAGLVDVTGFPTGTPVKCPYTGKIFTVP